MKVKRPPFRWYHFPKRLHFKNIPILAKLYLGFGIIFLIMILLSFVTYANYRKDKEASTLDVINQMNSQSMRKIDDVIQGLMNFTKLPIIRENNAYSDLFTLLDKTNNDGNWNLDISKVLEIETNRYMLYNSALNSVFLFNLAGKGDYSMPNGSIDFSSLHVADFPWFKEALNPRLKPVIVSTFKLPRTSSLQPQYVFGVARGIYKIEDSRMIGVIVVNADYKWLSNLVAGMKLVPNQRVFIVNRNQKLIYDDASDNIGQPAPSQLIRLLGQQRQNRQFKWNGTTYIASFKSSSLSEWTMINLAPVEEVNRNLNRMARTTLYITLAAMIITVVFASFFANRIVRPIKKLILLMRLAENGHFDKRIKLRQRDEIGQLARNFNAMSRRIKRLINEVYVEKISQKETELQLLKTQINPHFLYNTLESIRMVAETEGAEGASDMTFSLGRLLRYGLDTKKETVTVHEEIGHLKEYVSLLSRRFEEQFLVEINVDPDIMELPMIKLVLQPLVENAIYHGLSERSHGGKIHITGRTENNILLFEVSDNGKGMDAKLVSELNASFKMPELKPLSIGLSNVNKRLMLTYGPNYGLTVESELDRGTRFFVSLPI